MKTILATILIGLALCFGAAPAARCQNAANLPAMFNWVVPAWGYLGVETPMWKTVNYVEFQGYWVGDEHEDKPMITSKSLYQCYKATMACITVDVTSGFEIISLDQTPIKEWNEHRILIEDDNIRSSVPCPILNTTVVDIDHGYIKSFNVPVVGRWRKECKGLGLTPEVSTSSQTLAGLGSKGHAGTFEAYHSPVSGEIVYKFVE